ncbi:serine hydrolase [Lysinibacillus xylanilyticus]|uniref:serine hydrolase domain-containing protein n=1 Tax=Lysinibacillus xylanilyticus TaxID=582475 RepID=UPI002E1B925E|nr:serine hydrolase [Lysinibacillus xylanilyticus]
MIVIVMICTFFLVPKQDKVYATIDDLNEKIKQIKDEIENNMKRHDIPGMAFALVDSNGIIYSKGFGILDIRDDTLLIDENTNFNLGSLSKVFTTIAIMQLQEKGLLSIEDPVVDHLPWFKTREPSMSNQIKIKHLLNHSSGLPGRLNVHEIKSVEKQEIINEISDKLHDVILVAQPGDTFEYTNMNTDLLQIILEEVSGEPFIKFMDKNIFKPLGMNRTGYFTFDDYHLSNTAEGHRYRWGTIKPYKEELVYATSGSAGLSSNVTDLAKFIMCILNGGKIPTGYLISSTSINEMFQANKYGLGYNWYVYPHNMYMEGGLPGFTSTMVLSSDKSFGIVLLSNSKQNITYHSGFNLFRIVEGKTPKTLLSTDFPKVNTVAKIILGFTIIVSILLIYVVGPTFYHLSKGRLTVAFVKPSFGKCSIITFLLVLYLGVIYYIYVLFPFYVGVPSIFNFNKEPDVTTGLIILSIIHSLFSLALCLKILIIQKIDRSNSLGQFNGPTKKA